MPVDRVPATNSVIDVLDHVLDKGIVIDAWVRVSIAGIDLVTVEARIVVASIATYLTNANSIARLGPMPRYSAGPEFSLDARLRRLSSEIDSHDFDSQSRRRAEDRLRDQLHDERARTIRRH